MSHFDYRDESLHCEGVDLRHVVEHHGTPTYVYSATHILEQLSALEAAFSSVPHQMCYAVKTNSNLGVLGTLARAGAGFDIVSGGELSRLLRVGADPRRVVFAGVGKTETELRAALEAGIGIFNIESHPEADLLGSLAVARGQTAAVAVRVNPNLVAGGHRHISTGTASSKFGIPFERVVETYGHLARIPGLCPVGLHCHVGSQILDPSVYRAVAERLAVLVQEIRAQGHAVECVNVGGGIGIRYHDERSPAAEQYAAAILPALRGLDVRILLEPGRFVVGNAGVLLTRVLYRKATAHRTFVVVDAGMNDLVRPSLYDAHHEIQTVTAHPDREWELVDVVGPICESGDFMAKDRRLPRLETGDSIAICSAGAYGFVMSSNYNSRPRAAEVLVRGEEHRIVRQRESQEDLLRLESDWETRDPAGGAL